MNTSGALPFAERSLRHRALRLLFGDGVEKGWMADVVVDPYGEGNEYYGKGDDYSRRIRVFERTLDPTLRLDDNLIREIESVLREKGCTTFSVGMGRRIHADGTETPIPILWVEENEFADNLLQECVKYVSERTRK